MTASTGFERAPRSRLTQILGVVSLVSIAALLLFGLWFSGPEESQRDAARLFYIHVPSVAVAYTCFAITFVGSIIYLRKASLFWDLVAGAAAEIGVIFTVLVLATGALWGKPTWGVYWQWDARMTSTVVMLISYIGYLVMRGPALPQAVRSRRAAILGIAGIANVVIVHYSVQWWRGLHQGSTVGLDTQIDDLMLFSFFCGLVAMMSVGAWLLMQRFRVAWLDHQVTQLDLQQALAERQAESTGVVRLAGEGN